MNHRVRPFLVISLFIVLALALSACEKERPTPKPVNTVAAGGTRSVSAATSGTVIPTKGTAAVNVTPASPAAPVANNGTPMPPTPIPLQQPQATPAAQAGPTAAASSNTGNTTDTVSWLYTVVNGDTLADIAAKVNASRDAIVALNPGLDPDLLTTGQQLKIPGEAPPQYGGYARYTIQAGDTLASIARRYNTTVQELQSINAISDPSLITVGQVVKVPGNAAGSDSGTGTSAGAVPTTPAVQTTTYTVQYGDTLSSIARRFGTTVNDLMALNGLADANQVRWGQTLKVPATTQAVQPGQPAASRTYTVKSGETLYSIATRYGVSVTAVMQANNISNPNQIYAGQVLKIP